MAGSQYQVNSLKHGDRETCTCPHCWTVFPIEHFLYVARHPELLGDPILGPDSASRFKPTRFTADGHAIDPGGYPCLEMACPACHLEVPRSMTEFRSLFLSIVGSPQSGKSFFLTSMAWELRRLLASHFGFALTDLETTLNAKLHSYEEALFFTKTGDTLVTLPKTEQQGDMYNRVTFEGTDGMPTFFPRPFLFTLKPLNHHPETEKAGSLSRTLVLYDNAGEHFEPNQDTARQPGTMHMARSESLFFMFDPTQDPRFRAKMAGLSSDPQLDPGWHARRQDIIFNEAARRIRRHNGATPGVKHRKPVVVVVNKFDLWKKLLQMQVEPDPYISDRNHQMMHGLATGYVEDVSFNVRALLESICPEVVTAIEDFAGNVTYVPVSTIGHSPVQKDGGLYVKPSEIKPFWVAVPLLYVLTKLGLIYRGQRPTPAGVPRGAFVSELNGVTACRLPDGTRIDVPNRLAGKVVHHPRTGKPFVVPVNPAAPAKPAAGRGGA